MNRLNHVAAVDRCKGVGDQTQRRTRQRRTGAAAVWKLWRGDTVDTSDDHLVGSRALPENRKRQQKAVCLQHELWVGEKLIGRKVDGQKCVLCYVAHVVIGVELPQNTLEVVNRRVQHNHKPEPRGSLKKVEPELTRAQRFEIITRLLITKFRRYVFKRVKYTKHQLGRIALIAAVRATAVAALRVLARVHATAVSVKDVEGV